MWLLLFIKRCFALFDLPRLRDVLRADNAASLGMRINAKGGKKNKNKNRTYILESRHGMCVCGFFFQYKPRERSICPFQFESDVTSDVTGVTPPAKSSYCLW